MSTRLLIIALRALTMAVRLGLAAYMAAFLGLGELGTYALVSGVVAILPVLASAGLVHLVAREAVNQEPGPTVASLVHYWSLSVAIYFAMALVGLVAAAAAGIVPRIIWTTLPLCLLAQLNNDAFHLLVNRQRQLTASIAATLAGATAPIAFMTLGSLSPSLRSLDVYLLMWIGSLLVGLTPFIAFTKSWPWPKRRWNVTIAWYRSRLRGASLLLLSDITFILSQYFDRFVVSAFLGLEAAGTYFLMWSVANAINTFVSLGVVQIYRPKLIANSLATGGPSSYLPLYRRGYAETLVWSAIMGIAAVAGAALLLYLGIGQAIGANLLVFSLVVAGAVTRSMADYGLMSLFAMSRDMTMSLLNVTSLAIYAAASVLLVPNLGLFGAALATLVACLSVAALGHGIVARE